MKWLMTVLLATTSLALAKNKSELFFKPAHFPEPQYDFNSNPLNKGKVMLGRVLFYDPILSADSSISCASCHSPYNAFAHTDHDLSHGINDQIGRRNAPGLFNLAWQENFMWDGAISHLDKQALAPISSTLEMGETVEHIVKKLRRIAAYKKLFFNAFNDSSITGEQVLKALSGFQLTLVSGTSKYDSVQMGMSGYNIMEAKGYEIFKKNCNSCHVEPLFTNNSFISNGLTLDPDLRDFGRGELTYTSKDSMAFRVPSLRNLSFTYPYMHDGRFLKLSEAIKHYENLDLNDGKGRAIRIRLSSSEKTELTAFLLSLNDKNFLFDPKHQFPRFFFQ
ncbi:MAG: cytochrome-c peroxidase [Bacteroidia bacterium]|nr:cytochrome-c peroxidase [Bacteroidia bacterium]